MVEFIAEMIGRLGYVGVALLMLLETLIPPIPSEVIMPMVGLAAARGEMSILGGIAAAVIGASGGAFAWYLLARAIGRRRLIRFAERHGRWFGLSPKLVDQATAWFARRGGWAIFLARILPGMRVYISVPAGLADMAVPPFLAFTVAGYLVWYGFLGMVGYGMGSRLDPTLLWIISCAAVVVLIATQQVYRRFVAPRLVRG